MVTDIFLTVRLKSSRLPRKALATVADQTIIEHIIDRAQHIKGVDHIILCTSDLEEDQPLVDIAKKKGIPHFCGHPDNLVSRFVGASKLFNPDIGIRITGDNCLFSPEFIDSALEAHIEQQVEYTSTKELAGGSKGDIFTISALHKLHRLLQDELASEYLSWLFADERFFKVQWLSVDEAIKRPQYRLHCDTPDDLAFIREVYGHLYESGQIVDYRNMIKLLDEHPEIVALNQGIRQISKDDVSKTINLDLK